MTRRRPSLLNMLLQAGVVKECNQTKHAKAVLKTAQLRHHCMKSGVETRHDDDRWNASWHKSRKSETEMEMYETKQRQCCACVP